MIISVVLFLEAEGGGVCAEAAHMSTLRARDKERRGREEEEEEERELAHTAGSSGSSTYIL